MKIYKDYETDQEHRTFNLVGADGQTIHANVHLVDTTVYTQVGDNLSASGLNSIIDAMGKTAKTKQVTIPANAWSDKKCNINVEGVTATSIQILAIPELSDNPTPTEIEMQEMIANANIKTRGQSLNTIKLYALGDVPTKQIVLNVTLLGEPKDA